MSRKVWDVDKAVLGGKFIVLNTYNRKNFHSKKPRLKKAKIIFDS